MSIVGLSTNAKEVARGLDISAREMRLVMDGALQEAARRVEGDYDKVTRTWQHKPHIIREVNTRSGQFEMLVGTDDQVFGWVDRGTRKNYPIPKNPGPTLRFFSGFRPKTTPGHLGSGSGGSFGNIVFAKRVIHPGIKPRRFTEKIQERLEKYGPYILDRAVQRWARRR